MIVKRSLRPERLRELYRLYPNYNSGYNQKKPQSRNSQLLLVQPTLPGPQSGTLWKSRHVRTTTSSSDITHHCSQSRALSCTPHPSHGLVIFSQRVCPGLRCRVYCYHCTRGICSVCTFSTQGHLRTRTLEAQCEDSISIPVDESWILVSGSFCHLIAPFRHAVKPKRPYSSHSAQDNRRRQTH